MVLIWVGRFCFYIYIYITIWLRFIELRRIQSLHQIYQQFLKKTPLNSAQKFKKNESIIFGLDYNH